MLCARFSLTVSEGTVPEQEGTVTSSTLVLQRWLLSPLTFLMTVGKLGFLHNDKFTP